jgi:hypothetical protein
VNECKPLRGGNSDDMARQQAAMQAMQAQLALAQQWVAQQVRPAAWRPSTHITSF